MRSAWVQRFLMMEGMWLVGFPVPESPVEKPPKASPSSPGKSMVGSLSISGTGTETGDWVGREMILAAEWLGAEGNWVMLGEIFFILS